MADAFSRDRLLPALLDRLIDDEPGSLSESADARVLSRTRLRQSVLRDLAWLFNAQAAVSAQFDPERYPQVARSTLNYGIAALAGRLVSKVELHELERMLRQAIVDFEPRILPATLRVRGIVPTDPTAHHNSLSFEISGQLWAQPYPLELLLKTELDLETGAVELRDRSGSTVISQSPGSESVRG